VNIVWDEPKRVANLDKHGLDFSEFESGFSFDRFVALPARPSRTGRARFQLVGMLYGRTVVVAIVSPLGSEALSLVSLRLAGPRERRAYEEL
jgi:hypothetical protein